MTLRYGRLKDGVIEVTCNGEAVGSITHYPAHGTFTIKAPSLLNRDTAEEDRRVEFGSLFEAKKHLNHLEAEAQWRREFSRSMAGRSADRARDEAFSALLKEWAENAPD